MKKKKVLLAGATGYPGRYMAQQLKLSHFNSLDELVSCGIYENHHYWLCSTKHKATFNRLNTSIKQEMTEMKTVLVAGAMGYLGKFLLIALKKQGYITFGMVRDPDKHNTLCVDEIIQAEVTKPSSLESTIHGVDYLISTIGITRQKDGLTYMDVDYQANVNLLQEAKEIGVKKFVYVSVLNIELMRYLKMITAKKHFEDELKSSGMEYLIIRPNGFFSDMTEVPNMDRKGAVYLFGSGNYRENPIHGSDLAEFIISHLDRRNQELEVGGPDMLIQNEIAQAAFNALGKKRKIVHIPLWVRNASLKLIRWFSSEKTYGSIEFFMTVMTMHMIAPQFGKRKLIDYYREMVL